MLADSVEAAVRSLASHDEPAIRAMVGRIIGERLEDGQFDECDLTLRDLDRIREACVAQLLGMYHRRIEYPQNKIVEIESTACRVLTGRFGSTSPGLLPGWHPGRPDRRTQCRRRGLPGGAGTDHWCAPCRRAPPRARRASG